MTNQAYDIGLARVGEDVTIWPEAKIVFPDVVTIGDSVIIDDFAFLMGGKRTEIGSFVHIGSFTSITGGGELIMEDFSGCGSGATYDVGDGRGASATSPAIVRNVWGGGFVVAVDVWVWCGCVYT